jgi:hypothetical protein
MNSMFFDVTRVNDVDALLKMYGSKAFASPYRSTVPLVSLIKDDQALFEVIVGDCGISSAHSFHFEYKVTAPGSHGGPSQTDTMIFAKDSVLALEAKWTEPRYQNVKKRLKSRIDASIKKDSTGKIDYEARERTVINMWLALLGTRSKCLSIEDAGETIYQMVHRAASACASPCAPSLVYLHFSSPESRSTATLDHYRTDLEYLHSLIGAPDGYPFFLADLPLVPTKHFHTIQKLKKGTSETDSRVRDAIRLTKLFDFGKPSIERIGAKRLNF